MRDRDERRHEDGEIAITKWYIIAHNLEKTAIFKIPSMMKMSYFNKNVMSAVLIATGLTESNN